MFTIIQYTGNKVYSAFATRIYSSEAHQGLQLIRNMETVSVRKIRRHSSILSLRNSLLLCSYCAATNSVCEAHYTRKRTTGQEKVYSLNTQAELNTDIDVTSWKVFMLA